MITGSQAQAGARTNGSGLVEVVVGAAILSVVALAFLGTLSLLARFHQRDMLAIKGSLLAEEGIEAVRYIKGSGWAALASLPKDQDRYLEIAPASWKATTTPEIVDGAFYRSFRLSQVRRDASDVIVASGGTVDPGALLVSSTVSWNWRGATTSVTYTAYVTSI
ncbi:MAG TPA: hypothetical protein VFQ72_00825 [Candidatus Paceibacterota bacterium]|nr:hypothetical protein [Candidatus Paceibacterota bacterium]